MLNYFELFELPVQYSIDNNELTIRYLKKQREFHPDNSGSDYCSVTLNTAYSTLKNPLQRAEYVLSLSGKNADIMPSALAVKMFDLRDKFSQLDNDSARLNFISEQEKHVDDLLQTLKIYEIQSEEFYLTFCEAKFIHSFIEKVQNNACDRD